MFDFDEIIDRRGTASLKWDRYDEGVIPMWVADMDFRSPPAVIEAIERRARHGVFGYTTPPGDVVEAVVNDLRERHNWNVDPTWFVWLPALVPGLNWTCRAVGQRGDAVMTCPPIYPPILSAPVHSERQCLAVPLRLDGEMWRFDIQQMEAAITAQTRLFILCNPHNPVGRAYGLDELQEVAQFCIKHDLVLCSDEIHCDLILDDGIRHIPIATLSEGVAERTITLMAPSKTYNLPGLGCGFAIIPDAGLRAAFRHAARGTNSGVNAFGFVACGAAYRHGEPWRRALIAYLRANRDLVYSFVRSRLPEIPLRPMQATYLAWLDLRAFGLDDPLAHLERAGVGLSDGRDFGAPGHARLNFGCHRALLQQALERMEKALR